MVFDAVARHTSGILSMESFRKVIEKERPSLQSATPSEPEENALTGLFGHFPTLRETEDYMINEALKLAKGNQGIASSLLGMTRQTLNNRLKLNGKPD
jgi:DNA-binding NtrC family response regulator